MNHNHHGSSMGDNSYNVYENEHLGMHMNHTMNMGSMQMYFYAGYHDTIVLFKNWKITTIGELVGSMFAIFVLGALYEGLKVLREVLQRKYYVTVQTNLYSSPLSEDSTSADSTVLTHRVSTVRSRMISISHLIQTGLHMLQLTLSYCLMLVFMTYNVWLCLAVILGAGAGYFLFGWKKTAVVDVNEHCH